jgi:hypothetical protein
MRKYIGAIWIFRIIMTPCDIEWSRIQVPTTTKIAAKLIFLFLRRFFSKPSIYVFYYFEKMRYSEKAKVRGDSRDNLTLDTSIVS